MSGLGSEEKHLELKVGAMILVSLAILIAFVLILGDWTLESQLEMEIYFQNPGGLSPGAAVKVAGRKVGKITEMTFLGQTGPKHPTTGRPMLVRTRVMIHEEVYDSLRADARYYVTTKGMLGDPFLEIDPGSSNEPYNPDVKMFGIDPPRLDLFMADAYELVRGLNSLLNRNSEHLDTLLGGGARLVGTVEEMVDADGGVVETARVTRIIEGVENLVAETRDLVSGAKEKYVDDPEVQRTLKNLESLTGKLNRDIDPLLKEVHGALAEVNRLSDTIGPEEQRRIKSAIAKLDAMATRADKTIAGVDVLVNRLKNGEGTVGQLVKDEEIYDDIKELIRDIKKHPWKLIWED
jgi:phospholipid/cholesterol/gamma-HCH transport system substrate-binding protein